MNDNQKSILLNNWIFYNFDEFIVCTDLLSFVDIYLNIYLQSIISVKENSTEK